MSLINNEEIIIVEKAIGTRTKGHYTDGTTTYSNALASVQPINDNELQILQLGDRVKGTLKFYSSSLIEVDNFLRRSNENVKKIVTCTIDNVLDATDYTCTINSTEFLYNSGVGATALSIVAGIVSEISGGSELITVVDSLDGTYTITSSIKGTNFTIEVDDNQSANVDTENVKKEYKVLQVKDWTVHSIKYYKAYSCLVERANGL